MASLRTAGTTAASAYGRFLDHGSDADARASWHERSRRFERAAAAVQPQALLARVWSIPGSLHPAMRAGVLEPDALASLVVWNPDHPSMWPEGAFAALAMADTTQAIHAMFVAGREIGQAGDFHRSVVESDAYRQALRYANRRRVRVVAAAPW